MPILPCEYSFKKKNILFAMYSINSLDLDLLLKLLCNFNLALKFNFISLLLDLKLL